jgi:hypothetical protein
MCHSRQPGRGTTFQTTVTFPSLADSAPIWPNLSQARATSMQGESHLRRQENRKTQAVNLLSPGARCESWSPINTRRSALRRHLAPRDRSLVTVAADRQWAGCPDALSFEPRDRQWTHAGAGRRGTILLCVLAQRLLRIALDLWLCWEASRAQSSAPL